MASDIATYPFVLVHGFASRDDGIASSSLWGRIPARLRGCGASVWFGNQDAVGGVQGNAKQLAQSIAAVLEATGAPKVHVIAHSKGGLDMRCALHEGHTAQQVASLVTLASPHRGMRYCDAMKRSTLVVPRVVAPLANRRAASAGDAHPCGMQLLHDLTTLGAAELERRCPCPPGIACRSYAFASQSGAEPLGGKMVRAVVGHFDGENDGLVSLRSTEFAEWTVVRACSSSRRFRHDDAIDAHERDFPLHLPDGTSYRSIVDFVEALARQLAQDCP